MTNVTTDSLTQDQRERAELIEVGGFGLAWARDPRYDAYIQWAKTEGRFVDIGPHSPWASPFIPREDGSIITTARSYLWYLSLKPKLLRDMDTLFGKLLVCNCKLPDNSKEYCHAYVLGYALLELADAGVWDDPEAIAAMLRELSQDDEGIKRWRRSMTIDY